ncbi:MAG: hypothetical protein IPM50_00755 [Acidobacteriota bacterium]|nr:MAG: hypothetical protein IPM50_00755 [Acidobacteriota bacterium]
MILNDSRLPQKNAAAFVDTSANKTHTVRNFPDMERMMMRRAAQILTLAAVMLLSAAPAAFAQTKTAAAVTDEFYSRLYHMGVSGMPKKEQMDELSPYLSPGSLKMFERAAREQAEFIRKNPDQRPPWIEGDLFSSLFEGFTAFSTVEFLTGKADYIPGKVENASGNLEPMRAVEYWYHS